MKSPESECINHKPQLTPGTKPRGREKRQKLSNACKINKQKFEKKNVDQLSLPKRGDHIAKMTETHGLQKTPYSPCDIFQKHALRVAHIHTNVISPIIKLTCPCKTMECHTMEFSLW